MWIHQARGEPLSKYQLSMAVCRLILSADEDTRAKVQDVRKYAASCALAETMDVSDMVNTMEWSVAKTFWHFYITTMMPLKEPIVLPASMTQHQEILTQSATGRNVSPDTVPTISGVQSTPSDATRASHATDL